MPRLQVQTWLGCVWKAPPAGLWSFLPMLFSPFQYPTLYSLGISGPWTPSGSVSVSQGACGALPESLAPEIQLQPRNTSFPGQSQSSPQSSPTSQESLSCVASCSISESDDFRNNFHIFCTSYLFQIGSVKPQNSTEWILKTLLALFHNSWVRQQPIQQMESSSEDLYKMGHIQAEGSRDKKVSYPRQKSRLVIAKSPACRGWQGRARQMSWLTLIRWFRTDEWKGNKFATFRMCLFGIGIILG